MGVQGMTLESALSESEEIVMLARDFCLGQGIDPDATNVFGETMWGRFIDDAIVLVEAVRPNSYYAAGRPGNSAASGISSSGNNLMPARSNRATS